MIIAGNRSVPFLNFAGERQVGVCKAGPVQDSELDVSIQNVAAPSLLPDTSHMIHCDTVKSGTQTHRSQPVGLQTKNVFVIAEDVL